jgi:alpha-L-fucosidase 2
MKSGANKYILCLLFWGFVLEVPAQIPVRFIQSDSLASRWDEAMPLGNGLLGALIWQKDQHIRLSLDRADLWDERPMKGLHGPHFRFQWVKEKWHAGQYDSVQKMLDHPYDREPAPTKIPGAALEMPLELLGAVSKVSLDLYTASVAVTGNNGVLMSAFIDANRPYGWIRLKGVKKLFRPALVPPNYKGAATRAGDVVGGDDLSRLGYTQGTVDSLSNSYTYLQKGWKEFSYRVTVSWTQQADEVVLIWTITSSDNGSLPENPVRQLKKLLSLGYDSAFAAHQSWWVAHWAKSSIHIPDPILLKQWYLTRYLMGSASRKGAPPISLQAVWTADNGRIPPWKGDYHHDLNTELSYWPFYAANDLEGASVFIDHLEKNKANYERYTKSYFSVNGLNTPGVTTLKGTEMGGWIQ